MGTCLRLPSESDSENIPAIAVAIKRGYLVTRGAQEMRWEYLQAMWMRYCH